MAHVPLSTSVRVIMVVGSILAVGGLLYCFTRPDKTLSLQGPDNNYHADRQRLMKKIDDDHKMRRKRSPVFQGRGPVFHGDIEGNVQINGPGYKENVTKELSMTDSEPSEGMSPAEQSFDEANTDAQSSEEAREFPNWRWQGKSKELSANREQVDVKESKNLSPNREQVDNNMKESMFLGDLSHGASMSDLLKLDLSQLFKNVSNRDVVIKGDGKIVNRSNVRNVVIEGNGNKVNSNSNRKVVIGNGNEVNGSNAGTNVVTGHGNVVNTKVVIRNGNVVNSNKYDVIKGRGNAVNLSNVRHVNTKNTNKATYKNTYVNVDNRKRIVIKGAVKGKIKINKNIEDAINM